MVWSERLREEGQKRRKRRRGTRGVGACHPLLSLCCPLAVPLTMLPVGLEEAWQGWRPGGPSSLAGLCLRDPWQVSTSPGPSKAELPPGWQLISDLLHFCGWILSAASCLDFQPTQGRCPSCAGR